MAKKKETTKFTETELTSLKQLQSDYQSIQSSLGTLGVQRILLNQQMETLSLREESLNTQYEEIQSQEQRLVKELNDKYGAGNLNPETGEFTPSI
jgi:hypothetical protein